MANLDKPVLFESTHTVDGKPIMICFQTDQTIRLKLKSDKVGVLSIDVKDLYDYLLHRNDKPKEPAKPQPPAKELKVPTSKELIRKYNMVPEEFDADEPLMNMNDFRSAFLVSGDIPYEMKLKLESIAVGILAPYRKRKEEKRKLS